MCANPCFHTLQDKEEAATSGGGGASTEAPTDEENLQLLDTMIQDPNLQVGQSTTLSHPSGVSMAEHFTMSTTSGSLGSESSMSRFLPESGYGFLTDGLHLLWNRDADGQSCQRMPIHCWQ